MSESVELEEITAEQAQERFNQACENLLNISGAEFEDRIDRNDYSDLDRSVAMRVAMIRPSRKSA